MLRPNATRTGLVLAIPAPDDCTIPGYAVEQVGDWVGVALKKPHKWIGKFLGTFAFEYEHEHSLISLSLVSPLFSSHGRAGEVVMCAV